MKYALDLLTIDIFSLKVLSTYLKDIFLSITAALQPLDPHCECVNNTLVLFLMPN